MRNTLGHRDGVPAGERRTKGFRKDGWAVIVTAEINDHNENTFEMLCCSTCGIEHYREHDAEGWQLERAKCPHAEK